MWVYSIFSAFGSTHAQSMHMHNRYLEEIHQKLLLECSDFVLGIRSYFRLYKGDVRKHVTKNCADCNDYNSVASLILILGLRAIGNRGELAELSPSI